MFRGFMHSAVKHTETCLSLKLPAAAMMVILLHLKTTTLTLHLIVFATLEN